MLDRMVRGRVPTSPHAVFRDPEGALLHEHCLTRSGFDGPYTIAYHRHPPHHVRPAEVDHGWRTPRAVSGRRLDRRHYRSDRVGVGGPAVDCRVPLLFNDDVTLSVMSPDAPDPVWFADADADHLVFVRQGGGVLHTPLGALPMSEHDYVFVPRGLAHRFVPDGGSQHWFDIACTGGVGIPEDWRNSAGQLRMDAPYSHRDFRRPSLAPHGGELRELLVRRNGDFHGFSYLHDPLDVVGWDGTVYPWALSIHRFRPRVASVHLPPTAHGTFAARGALICSFVPRMVDFGQGAIPCPYPHSSFDIDEVLLYVAGDFTSRTTVGPGSLSHHPAGVPHGPHPGAYEGSIGAERTDELAVMLDCARPLHATAAALEVEDGSYSGSFLG